MMLKRLAPALAIALIACSSSEPKPDAAPAEEPTVTVDPQEGQVDVETQAAEPGDQAEAPDVRGAIEAAATGEHRSEKNIARNAHRHPVETLSFFGVEPDMTVVELWPGGGWYTEVLAPTLSQGTLVAASFAPKPDDPEHYRTRLYNQLKERIETDPVFSNVEFGMLQPPKTVDIGEPGSADMVVTFRNIHSFVSSGIEDEVFAAAYDVLKPGGILGVVQHRAPEGSKVEETVETGYIPQAFVIEQAKEAGFELVDTSEINANPKDTKDHPEGVWTLPPSYRLGDKDRAKYEAIGESDRMTLKFRKPADAGAAKPTGGEPTAATPVAK